MLEISRNILRIPGRREQRNRFSHICIYGQMLPIIPKFCLKEPIRYENLVEHYDVYDIHMSDK